MPSDDILHTIKLELTGTKIPLGNVRVRNDVPAVDKVKHLRNQLPDSGGRGGVTQAIAVIDSD